MPDPLPGPIRPHSAGPPRDQDRHAMELALSVLRGTAYRVGASDATASQQRGDAIDALAAALGHTVIIANTRGEPLPHLGGRVTVEPFRLGKPGEHPDPVLLIDALRSAHGERLDRLERLLYGEGVGSYRPNPDRLAVLAQLDAQSSVLGNLAEALERDNDARRDLTRRVEALESDGPGPAPDEPSPAFRPGHELDCALADGHPLPCRDTAGTDLTIPF